MTTVWPRAHPSAVATLARLSVRTSKFMSCSPPGSVEEQHGSNRRRLIMTPGHGERALRAGDLGTRRLPSRRRVVGSVRAGDGLGGWLWRTLAGLQRGSPAACAGAGD